MPTENQKLGKFGEMTVAKFCSCPRCKRPKTLRTLPQNFKCADIICDFCGYLAQVKARKTEDLNNLPPTIIAAAWGPQNARMSAGIYFPLFVVQVCKPRFSIFYLAADLQNAAMFKPRNKLKPTARRAGWQGFMYDLREVPSGAVIRIK